MGATGYIIKGHNGGRGGEARKEVVVSAADGTIDVEKVETFDKVDFRIKTTYDGYETINVGSPASGGYFKAAHIKFNEKNRRYRLVCILNGGSYTPVAKDFAIYYIKFGWRTGGANADHWYIEEYSRQGNGAYVSLEQIALNEYNVLIHTPTGYAYANIGILKEDKEPDVTIDHFNNNTTRYTPTGTIIETEIPTWKNGALVDTNPEDLEIRNGLLQLADRSSINGLGYVILRPDKTFSEQVTQSNCIYEVRYNFDLGGGSVTIPSNCTLQFDGGSIRNGSINFNKAEIVSANECFSNITFTGFKVINAEWFGITTNSTDISSAFNDLMLSIIESNEITTVLFKPAVYHTLSTLKIGIDKQGEFISPKCINIKGNPTFFLDANNTTCIHIKGGSRNTYEFSVARQSPSIWANNECVGVVLENSTYCSYKIHNILYFTIGIICHSSDGKGFGWNEIYIDEIYSPLQGFVIKSTGGGWINANNVHGGLGCNTNTGTFNKTGATMPRRFIVLKTDGQYGANGWSFEGLWFEMHDEELPELGTCGIDFCDFANGKGMNGCSFTNCRIEYVIHEGQPFMPVIKIDKRYSKEITMQPTLLMGTAAFAYDENNNEITDTQVYNIIPQYKKVNLINYQNGIQDELSRTLNCVSNYIFKNGGKLYAIGALGEISPSKYLKSGYDSIGQCFSNFQGKEFRLRYYTERCKIHFLDISFNNLDPSDNSNGIIVDTSDFIVVQPGEQYAKYYQDNGVNSKYVERKFKVISAGLAKYISISFTNLSGANIDVSYLLTTEDTSLIEPINPFGNVNSDIYISDIPITSIRAQFNKGDKYYDIASGNLYEFDTSGSLNMVSRKVTGTQDTNFVTYNGTITTIVGDIVTIGGTEYVVQSLDADTNKIYFTTNLISNYSDTWMTGKKPAYSVFGVKNGTSTQRPTLSSNEAGYQFFDTDLGKPIYWTGSKWVDANGNDLQ